jgi:ComF family protein
VYQLHDTPFGPVEHNALWPKRNGAEVFRKLAELSRGALELVVPSTCGACGTRTDPTAALCPACDSRLERIAPRACQLCQETAAQIGNRLCTGCGVSDSPLTACIAAVRFEGSGAEWIHRFKYPKRGLRGLDPAPASVVGAMLREAASRAPGPQPDLIVPVPLHPRRLRLRGFNPAAQIARSLAREFEIPFDAVALRRTRDTPSQTGFDRRDRRSNVRGAFRSRRGRCVPERIWLVDDVVTTTSTLSEAAIALRTAGASTIIGLCAARALLDGSSAG